MKKHVVRTLFLLLWATLLGARAFLQQGPEPKPLMGGALTPQSERGAI